MKRRIGVLTTSRADYSHLFWVLRELDDAVDLEPSLIVTAAHLEQAFGQAVQEIERDGFQIAERIDVLDDSDSDLGMARTIGRLTLRLTDALERMRPDLLLLIADRYEMLAPAAVATALRIPIAHVEGGEISEGAIDDAVRNALTKLSHVHFTPHEAARRRVLAMGEERWRVHRVGAPSLDHLVRSELIDRPALERELGVGLAERALVVAFHPLTIARETLREADALFEALGRTRAQILFCCPNADAGGRELAQRAERFCRSRDAAMFTNLNPVIYWSLLRHVDAIVGNSSSGIMESPSLALPCVNVGMRQQGRQRAPNILDVPADAQAISETLERALDPEFRTSLRGMRNPYGDGTAARRIVEVLATVPLGEQLLLKRAVPLP